MKRSAPAALGAAPLAAQAAIESQHVLAPAGPQANLILYLGYLVVGTCVVVFALLMVALYLSLRRSARGNEDTPPDLSGLGRRERAPHRAVIGGVAVSIFLLVGLIVASAYTDRALGRLPLESALNVRVTANQWWWDIRYDDRQPSRIFTTANELYVPVGRPILVMLQSNDVIHSFWVPNLHGKRDLIPGRTTSIAFRADRPGVYRGQCAEFCGFQHARMALTVVAVAPESYEKWADAQRRSAREPETDLEKRGKEVFLSSTCVMCHQIVGTPANARTGPDLTHVASRQTLAAGTLTNGPGALAGWILDPQSVKPAVNMPQHTFAPDDLHALVAYLASLK